MSSPRRPGWVQSAAGVRAVDRMLIDGVGVPELVLMEQAGHGVADAIRAWSATLGLDRPSALVVCGGGNNGGDGYVIARHLALAGWDVRCLAALPPQSPSCRVFHDLAERFGLLGDLAAPDIVVDAVFGTGQRPGTPDFGWSRWANARLVAVDVPTGVDADTGRVVGVCPARVDRVVTIGRAKPFLFAGSWGTSGSAGGRARWEGDWDLVDIGFDLGGARGVPVARLEVSVAAPPLGASANKWDRGHVAVIAGAEGTLGAAVLCCRGVMRAGAGLVTLFGSAAAYPGLPAEVMIAPGLPGEGRFDAIVVGPGVGRGRDAELRRLWATSPLPMVVDADALRIEGLASVEPAGLRLLTPHAGEAAAWLGVSRADVDDDRLGIAGRLRGARTAAVLKGECPLVTGDVPTVFEGRCATLGTAGSGDVLAGICGALLASLRPASVEDVERAARMAVSMHLAAGRSLRVGALASEIADAVRR